MQVSSLLSPVTVAQTELPDLKNTENQGGFALVMQQQAHNKVVIDSAEISSLKEQGKVLPIAESNDLLPQSIHGHGCRYLTLSGSDEFSLNLQPMNIQQFLALGDDTVKILELTLSPADTSKLQSLGVENDHLLDQVVEQLETELLSLQEILSSDDSQLRLQVSLESQQEPFEVTLTHTADQQWALSQSSNEERSVSEPVYLALTLTPSSEKQSLTDQDHVEINQLQSDGLQTIFQQARSVLQGTSLTLEKTLVQYSSYEQSLVSAYQIGVKVSKETESSVNTSLFESLESVTEVNKENKVLSELQQAISKQSKQGNSVLISDQQAQVVSKLEVASTSLAPPATIILPAIKLESTVISNSSPLTSTQDLRSQLSAVLDGKAAAHLTEQFSSRVVVMVQNNAQNAVIRLDPAELGHLEIQIETKADEIKVTVVTATHSVKDALEEHIHRLKEQMLQQGFDQVDVDVRQQQDSQQEASNTNASEESDEDEMLNEQPQQRLTQGLVDQFV